jgi:hypothetical protein
VPHPDLTPARAAALSNELALLSDDTQRLRDDWATAWLIMASYALDRYACGMPGEEPPGLGGAP